MSGLPLGPPVRISPLIKAGRWSFLVVGILYGAAHQSRLSKREVGIREEEARLKVIRDAKIEVENKRNRELEQQMIDELSNPKKAVV